jgi:hypothetical protein
MNERRPAALHLLACYILFRFKEELGKRGLIGNFAADHRLQFEDLVFLVGEDLRTGFPRFEFGLQTIFHARLRAQLITVKTVLEQCIEQGWIYLPATGSSNCNYRLSDAGERWIGEVIRADGIQIDVGGRDLKFLDNACRLRIDKVILRWLGSKGLKLQFEIKKVAGRASIEPRVVPHYDLSDPAFRPFFDGVAARQADAVLQE